MSSFICSLCEKGNFKFLFESEGFTFNRCDVCGYVRRKESSDISIYEEETYTDQFMDEEFHSESARLILEDIEHFCGNKGSILDIGCSTGFLLSKAAERGWTPFGLDVSEAALEKARIRGVEKNQCNSIEGANYSAETFDVVVFKHVLEHLDEPFPILMKISTWIKPHGLLCIGVPNFASFSSKRDGKNWGSLFPKEHISQFTPKTLKMAVSKSTGFDILEIKGNHSYGGLPKGLKQSINFRIDRLKDYLLVGRDMILFARKPG